MKLYNFSGGIQNESILASKMEDSEEIMENPAFDLTKKN